MQKQVVMNGKDHIIIKFDQFFQIGRNMIQLLDFIVRVPCELVLLIKKYIQATTKSQGKRKIWSVGLVVDLSLKPGQKITRVRVTTIDYVNYLTHLIIFSLFNFKSDL